MDNFLCFMCLYLCARVRVRVCCLSWMFSAYVLKVPHSHIVLCVDVCIRKLIFKVYMEMAEIPFAYYQKGIEKEGLRKQR